jgi:hypothetical protein
MNTNKTTELVDNQVDNNNTTPEKEWREDEHQEILTKMLMLERPYSAEIEPASWAEIYEAIGKLKERANQPPQVIREPWPSQTMPLTYTTNHPNPACPRCGGEIRGMHAC